MYHFVIDERKREDYPTDYRYYKRHFWRWDNGRKFNLSFIVKGLKYYKDQAASFKIGNAGSETPWDGHFILFGIGFYWSHDFFRKLASWLTRCSGYTYDNRKFGYFLSDGRLHWYFAEHIDVCDKHRGKKFKRYGSFRVNLKDIIWGPERYSYTPLYEFNTTIDMPEGSYPARLEIQEVRFGRTKIDVSKHAVSYSIDVDAPKGVPTHVDHSAGYKGDRTYGWGLAFDTPDRAAFVPGEARDQMEKDAVAAVWEWVVDERKRTGFVKPDPVERD